MSQHAWISVIVTLAVVIIVQVRRRAPTDLLFLGGLVIVTLCGVITPEQALSGFQSTAVIAIGSLFVVSAGLRSTGVLDWVGEKLLGSAMTEESALKRLAVVLITTSAFVLNTVLVAMFVPIVVDWCRKRSVSPSRLLIPVSYLTILGGVCTLIGTSTTLIVNAELNNQHAIALDKLAAGAEGIDHDFVDGVKPMGLFDLAWIGIPCALVGGTFLLLVARRLLPDRRDMVEQFDEQRREYLVELLVSEEYLKIGQTVQKAGLRSLAGLFLIEIDRDGRIITPVTPQDTIQAGDRLVFTGLVETIVDLKQVPGLIPAADQTFDMHDEGRHLTEAVLSRSSPLIGSTVKAANFRRRYDAAVIAVHRNGERLTNKIGNINLEPGDTLLLQTRTEFATRHRNNRDFFLVSPVEGYAPRRYDKARLAALLGIGLIVWLCFLSWWPNSMMPIAAITIACLMIGTRCVSPSDARAAIDLRVLLTIAGALGLGASLRTSGAASGLAAILINSVSDDPYVLLLSVYILAMLFTEMITNNAVAAILLPLAVEVARVSGHNPRPFVFAIALAASLSFITPIGYQTNLMVMGPGGYQPRDYLRAGLPLAIVVLVTAVGLLPVMWPF